MAGDAQFGPAPDPDVPHGTQTPHLPRDPLALREAVTAALAAGDGPGRVYAQVVRPALADVGDVAGGGGPLADDRRALARSSAHGALADLVERLPASDEGLGRTAAVLIPAGVLGELDGRALADALEAGNWRVASLAQDDGPRAVADEIVAGRAEVLVVPAGDAAQVLAAQQTLSLVRRVKAPPLIVAVAFGAASTGPSSMAADHVVETADALAPLLGRRMGRGGHGPTPWGVRLDRDAAGLVVAPVGLLDPSSVARLREIVETRRTLYPRIVIDLRELMAAELDDGLAALVSWDAELPWDPTVAALGDPRTVTALAEAGLTGALPLAALPA